MRDKRGISAIVATVLIILIIVAAVAIVWVAILPMISDGFDVGVGDVRLTVSTQGGYTVYDKSADRISVQVFRGTDDIDIKEMRIVVVFSGDSFSQNVSAPNPASHVTYTFDISSYVSSYGDPTSVSVFPVYLDDKVGMASDDIEFKDGDLSDISDVSDLFLTSGDVECEFNDDCVSLDSCRVDGACNSGVCSYTDIVDAINDDDCCPSGATPATDNNCVTCAADVDCPVDNVCYEEVCSYKYVWQQDTSAGSLFPVAAWTFNIGYKFVPLSTREVIELCRYATGTKTVKLYNDSYGIIASVDVVGSADVGTWSCEVLSSSVTINAGSTYYVAAQTTGITGYYQNGDGAGLSYPFVYNEINISASILELTGDTLTGSHFDIPDGMLGQVDIGLSPA